MTNRSQSPEKPVSEKVRPEITKLPELTPGRKIVRMLWRAVARFLARVLTRVELKGLENFPTEGGVLVVTNHLGDADFVLGLAFSPRPLEFLIKSELYDIPVLGALLLMRNPFDKIPMKFATRLPWNNNIRFP